MVAGPLRVPYPEPTDDAVGEVVFDHDGTEHRLVAWGEDDGSLWILFRDATSGVTTYPANRQLVTAPPVADGEVSIDFNRALQHAVRVHRLRHLPAAPGGQHAAVRGRGRREDPDATGVTHLAKIGTEGTPTSLVSAQSTT